MKKKICLVSALVLAAALLTACGSEKPAETTPAETTTPSVVVEDTQTVAGAYTFTYKGTAIDLKADAAPIIAALGEPKSYTEETSCAFDGLDKNYTYSSFILTTYPDKDTDRVNSVTVMDDTVSTAAGICIGDSTSKVEEAYGADSFNGVNAYIITEGDAKLTIIIDNDKVSSIQYTAVFE